MEQFHLYETREFHRLLEREWLERIEAQLWDFAQDLDAWLHALFAHPTAKWRDDLEAFLTDQSAAGREVTPESREELEAFLESWAAELFAPAEGEEVPTNDDDASAASDDHAVVGPVRPPVKAKRGRFADHANFYLFLADAKQAHDDLEKVVQQFAGQLNAAGDGAETEVEPYLNQVEALIWRHNDSMEQARHAWLHGQMGAKAFDKLVAMSTPVAHGLPMFVDKAQAERANAQLQAIGKKLNERIGTLDNVILAMQVTETAIDVTTALMGMGLVVAAAKKGGKMVVIKAAGQIIAGQVAAPIINKAVDAGLEAAGVDKEVVNKLQDAVDIINKLMMLRRLGGSLKKMAATQTSTKLPTPESRFNESANSESRGSTSHNTYRTQSGDLDVAARKARSYPYRPSPARPTRKKTFPPIEGTIDKPRSKHHTFLQRALAEEMRATGEYVRITMRMKLSTISGVKHIPDIEPDNIGVDSNGRIDIFEILSPSQTKDDLQRKLEHALEELPEAMRGSIRVIDPSDAFK